MKKIIQGLLLLLLFTSANSSLAEQIQIRVIVPKPPYSVLPKTGQTVSYGGEKDDGYYQMGNPVTPRFTAGTGAATGTVTDNVTGLMWEQKTYSGISNVTNYYTWFDAFNVFLNGPQGLNTANFAGHKDWRIPNINELQSIVDYSQTGTTGPTIYSIFTPTAWYWGIGGKYCTSDTYTWETAWIWYIEFLCGQSGYYLKTGHTDSHYLTYLWFVRAVRGGSGGLH